MRPSIAPFLLVAIIAGGCGANPTAPSAAATLSIQAGQTSSAAGLTVKFIGVSNDSRCPIDAFCITNGDADAQFELGANGNTTTVKLQVANPANRRATFRGYAIEIQELGPYPAGGLRIDAGDYRITIKISSS